MPDETGRVPLRRGRAAARLAGARLAGARLAGALLLAALALPAACAQEGGDTGAAAEPGARERSALLGEVLRRAVSDAYGRTAAVSRQPRDRFLREIVGRAGVLDEARAAGLPLDLLADSYVATAGAGSAAGVELLDVGDEPVARALAVVLAQGGTPSHRCASAETPISGESGWLLTCTAVEPRGRQLFLAVVAVDEVVIVAQESGPRADQVAAAILSELRGAEPPR